MKVSFFSVIAQEDRNVSFLVYRCFARHGGTSPHEQKIIRAPTQYFQYFIVNIYIYKIGGLDNPYAPNLSTLNTQKNVTELL